MVNCPTIGCDVMLGAEGARLDDIKHVRRCYTDSLKGAYDWYQANVCPAPMPAVNVARVRELLELAHNNITVSSAPGVDDYRRGVYVGYADACIGRALQVLRGDERG